MAFNSAEYFVFLAVMAFGYYLSPSKHRIWILLAGSAFFYFQFNPAYLVILFLSIAFNYLLGYSISTLEGRRRTGVFVMALGINIVYLFFFRIDFMGLLFKSPYSLKSLNILMPLGISFFTFANISYLVEIYRKKNPAEKRFVVYATHISFFPKLLQGPIVRPDFISQLVKEHRFNYGETADGIKLIMWGLFKKTIIADRAALIVNQVFDNPTSYTGMPLVLATILFSIQIYADFSGYTDMARGSAKIFGFHLPLNFNGPYFSKSIGDFWNRWHMTLSSWLRDYIYLPISFWLSRKIKNDKILFLNSDKAIYFFSINATFIICGLWHGIGWHYIAWGLIFGIGLSVAVFTRGLRKKFKRKMGLLRHKKKLDRLDTLFIFILVSFAWIFFRANTVPEALYIVKHIFRGIGNIAQMKSALASVAGGDGLNNLVILLFFAIVLFVVESRQKAEEIYLWIKQKPAWLRWTFYYAVIMAIFSFGVFDRSPFLYFRF